MSIQAQITTLLSDGKPPYQSPHGPLFGYRVEFSDGQGGLVNSKSQPPPYRVGETVYYEISGQVGKLNKLKISKNPPMGAPTMAIPTVQVDPRSITQHVVSQQDFPPNVEADKPVFGATVGMSLNLGVEMLTKGMDASEMAKLVETDAFWNELWRVSSRIITLSRHLEAGRLANARKGQEKALPVAPKAQPKPESHPDLEPSDTNALPF